MERTSNNVAPSWAAPAQVGAWDGGSARRWAVRTPAGMTDLCPQVLGVTEQLDAGVRYLDLRVAHVLDGSEKNLHFVHMVYTTALVEVWGRVREEGWRAASTQRCMPTSRAHGRKPASGTHDQGASLSLLPYPSPL